MHKTRLECSNTMISTYLGNSFFLDLLTTHQSILFSAKQKHSYVKGTVNKRAAPPPLSLSGGTGEDHQEQMGRVCVCVCVRGG